ncbi:Kelch motif/galactose oxidase, central domain containing protein, putative [Leishmania tarentolae]|uniref:Kelch motif/galactose oxidase, central domain containing protein, putative n=1 Tax=Leishmania tarentolae TaxID=5689 RepID=A0A640KHW8_LEITA|nr:Kelch motif/galactose oxidase, central domain containing protein, putative [Leishmania tarentolae]
MQREVSCQSGELWVRHDKPITHAIDACLAAEIQFRGVVHEVAAKAATKHHHCVAAYYRHVTLAARRVLAVDIVHELKRVRLHVVDEQVVQLLFAIPPAEYDDVAVVHSGAIPGTAEHRHLRQVDAPPHRGIEGIDEKVFAALAAAVAATKYNHSALIRHRSVSRARRWDRAQLVALLPLGVAQVTAVQVLQPLVAVASAALASENVHGAPKHNGTVAIASHWNERPSHDNRMAVAIFANIEELVEPTSAVAAAKNVHARAVPNCGVKRPRVLLFATQLYLFPSLVDHVVLPQVVQVDGHTVRVVYAAVDVGLAAIGVGAERVSDAA